MWKSQILHCVSRRLQGQGQSVRKRPLFSHQITCTPDIDQVTTIITIIGSGRYHKGIKTLSRDPEAIAVPFTNTTLTTASSANVPWSGEAIIDIFQVAAMLRSPLTSLIISALHARCRRYPLASIKISLTGNAPRENNHKS